MTDSRVTQSVDLLEDVAARARRYLDGLETRAASPDPAAVAAVAELGGALPEESTDPAEVLALLDRFGSPATLASAGPRYFGFVVGGALPAALAASWLAGAWDQNAAMVASSPAAAAIEAIALRWVLDALGLPTTVAGGFVTGATAANLSGLAAARHAVLRRVGWDVEAQGLFGAPPITVLVGDEVHASLLKALALLGLGRERVVRVAVDGQGRMDPAAFPTIEGPTIVCLQAGNVNTGAFDPAAELIPLARAGGAWIHVDGAFGIWAAAAPDRAPLVRGVADADSWATDAHKWLNVPYDSGIVLCRDGAALRAAMSTAAAYLPDGAEREPYQYTPEMSRRARGVEVWAALRSLGRSGLADLIERNCRQAARFAEGMRAGGHAVLNEVCLNQVLVSFGDDETTRRVIAAVQAEGTCWCGGTVWHGRAAMRVSVSSWRTTEADIDRSVEAVVRTAASVVPLRR